MNSKPLPGFLSTERDDAFLTKVDRVGNVNKWFRTAFVESLVPEKIFNQYVNKLSVNLSTAVESRS